MIKFIKGDDKLLLEYSSYNSFIGWISDEFHKNKSITLSNTYTLTKADLFIEKEDDPEDWDNFEDYVYFCVAKLEGNYFHFKKSIFSVDIELFIDCELKITDDFFRAPRNISIIKKISKILKEDIYIGNYDNSNLPTEEYLNLIRNFPNSYEIDKYVNTRISVVIDDYFNNITDSKEQYEKYMNKKIGKSGKNLITTFQSYEAEKYKIILGKLKNMLSNQESYIEKQWQREINEIILLLYPKYLKVFEEVKIKDYDKNTDRYIDFMLLDNNGNIDLIEVKRPLNSSVLGKREYRNNYVPKKELSGSIMQIEKYVYHLNKWGHIGEKKLTEKYKDQLPDNLKISISNPSGIIIMGRDHDLNKSQLKDFEIIKRKYKNIIDIITYDDLIRRLNSIIKKFSK